MTVGSVSNVLRKKAETVPFSQTMRTVPVVAECVRACVWLCVCERERELKLRKRSGQKD